MYTADNKWNQLAKLISEFKARQGHQILTRKKKKKT